MFARFTGKIAVLASLLVGTVGTANAIPTTTWIDLDVDLFGYVSPDNPYSYEHDITGGAGGFRPGIDSISNATLTILLTDDFLDLGSKSETVDFSFDGQHWSSSDTLGRFDFTVTSLLGDGLLGVNLTAARGDFLYFSSLLVVSGERGGATLVPEPATLSLFGFGVLMMGLLLRRRRVR